MTIKKIPLSELNEENLPEGIALELFEALYSELSGSNHRQDFEVNGYHVTSISIDDVFKTGMLNRTAKGSITIDGEDFEFKLSDGNNNGSEILEFGQTVGRLDKSVIIRIPTPLSKEEFEKLKGSLHVDERYDIYLKNFESFRPRLEELERKSSYDNFFSPTTKVQDHYKKEFSRWPEDNKIIPYKWVEKVIESD